VKHPQTVLETAAIVESVAFKLLRRLSLRDEGLDLQPLLIIQFGCVAAGRKIPFDQPCSRKALQVASFDLTRF